MHLCRKAAARRAVDLRIMGDLSTLGMTPPMVRIRLTGVVSMLRGRTPRSLHLLRLVSHRARFAMQGVPTPRRRYCSRYYHRGYMDVINHSIHVCSKEPLLPIQKDVRNAIMSCRIFSPLTSKPGNGVICLSSGTSLWTDTHRPLSLGMQAGQHVIEPLPGRTFPAVSILDRDELAVEPFSSGVSRPNLSTLVVVRATHQRIDILQEAFSVLADTSRSLMRWQA